MQAHFDTFYSLPPEVTEAKERGEITQSEIDERIAAGEFEKVKLTRDHEGVVYLEMRMRSTVDLPSEMSLEPEQAWIETE